MRKCIKCGAALPEEAIFCHICGKKQVQEKRKALKRANGTGTVYKLQGRRSRPWVAAKNKVVIGYYAKKTDALEALEHLSGKDLTDRYNMTFAEVFESWKKEHYKSIGEKSKDSYDNAYKIFATLHDKKFRDLRVADRLSPSTRSCLHKCQSGRCGKRFAPLTLPSILNCRERRKRIRQYIPRMT